MINIKNILIPLLIINFCILKNFAQTSEELLKLAIGEASALSGKSFKWDVIQTTYFSDEDLLVLQKSLKNQISELDPYDPNYSVHKANLESTLETVKNMPLVSNENIEINAEIISLSKWKITFWPRHIGKEMATTYYSNGVDAAVRVDEGQKKIRVYKNSALALMDVLRGVPTVHLYAQQFGIDEENLTKDDKLNAISFISRQSDLTIKALFDPDSLKCTQVAESSGETLLRSIKVLDDNKSSVEQFIPGSEEYQQTQVWELNAVKPISKINDTEFTYLVKPGYYIEIPTLGTDYRFINSDSIAGKVLKIE